MTQPTIKERRERVASALHDYVLHDKRSHPCEAAEVLCGIETTVQPSPDRALISPDVLCELAHELTVRECRIRDITVDARIADDQDGETLYTDEAQSIFEAIHDIVSAVLDPYCEKGGAQ